MRFLSIQNLAIIFVVFQTAFCGVFASAADKQSETITCGTYHGRGKLFFNPSGSISFALVADERMAENRYIEALLIGGPLEEKLRKALSEVNIEFRVEKEIPLASKEAEIQLIKFLPKSEKLSSHLTLIRKDKCKSSGKKSVH